MQGPVTLEGTNVCDNASGTVARGDGFIRRYEIDSFIRRYDTDVKSAHVGE